MNANTLKLYRTAWRSSARTAYTSTTPVTVPNNGASAAVASASSCSGSAAQHQFPVSSLRSTSRALSTTSFVRASEAPKSHWEQRGWQSEKPMFERLQQNPEAFAAIENLANLIQKKTGVSLQSGEPPSMSVMVALVRDPEMREAAERLMKVLRASGIEVDPQAAFRALQMMGGEGFEGNMEINALHEAMRKAEGDGSDEGDKGKK
ncbi:hypothetical protein OIV83_001000 [Microbotryomycetes sp. JL201]|nr:hypothetical protein OIV83_001000 [Microbotryomycetes sp. JL201]